MGRYLNRLYCMMVAMVSSYAVNMIYQINTAFAAASDCPPTITRVRLTTIQWVCTQLPGSTDYQQLQWWGGSVDDVNFRGSDTPYPCHIPTAMAAMRNTNTGSWNSLPSVYDYMPDQLSGLTLGSCFLDMTDVCVPVEDEALNGCISGVSPDASTTYLTCNFDSHKTEENFQTIARGCGYAEQCIGPDGYATDTAIFCNTGPNAGYLANNGQYCSCCPGTKYVTYGTVGKPSILSIYNAAAISSCYVAGKFKDEFGYFENQDSNNCTYNSGN